MPEATQRPSNWNATTVVLGILAIAWITFVAWRVWSQWPTLPLDSGGDSGTIETLRIAWLALATEAVLVALGGVILLTGAAIALQGKRPAASTPTKPNANWNGPRRILLTRHAEKTGALDDIHLSKSGRKRAERLATYIPETFGAPDFIYAAARSKRSIRSIETMQPLAAALGKDVQFDIEDRDFPRLVERLRSDAAFRNSLVIVCWHHGKLPDIAAQLGAPDGSYPSDWPAETFDLILELDYAKGAPPVVKQVVEPF